MLLAPLLIAYPVISVATIPGNRTELFPFFCWSLFSDTSSDRSDVTLRIRSIDGELLSEPRLFYDMSQEFAAARVGDAKFSKLLDQLAYFVRRDDRGNVARLRSLVEANFLSDVESVDYDLVRIYYDPIERYQSGEIKRVAVLWSFSKAPLP